MAIIDRIKNIILTPAKEWDVIATETPNTSKILTGYVLPLAVISAAASFIGYGLIGINAGFFKMSGISWGIYYALTVFISAFVSIFLGAFVIDALAPSFASEKNIGRSMQLVAYSFTPGLVGGLLSILPALSFIGVLLSLYGLYLLYLGLPKLKNTPQDKHVSYFVVSLLVLIVVNIVVGIILSKVMMPIFGLSMNIDVPGIKLDM